MPKSKKTLLEDLPRGVRTKDPSAQVTPRAAWANTENILASEKLKYNSNKILLGCIDGQLIGTDEDRHIITIAGSRAGKGVSVIIPNLIHYRGSVLVIDPKGELASITAEQRAKNLGQEVHVLDPFKRTAPWTEKYHASFNPFSILKDETHMIENANLISDALIVHNTQGDPHWDESAREVLEGVILHVATYPRYEGKRHLITLRRLLLEGVNVQEEGKKEITTGIAGLLLEMQYNPALDGFVFALATSIKDKPEKERGSIIGTAQRHTKFLDLPPMRNVLEGNDFNLSDLKTDKNGVTVYLCLPTGRMSTCSRWLRLFINLALEAMESTLARPQAKASETATGAPVLFCLDEFATLGHMQQMEVAAGQIAGFGVKLWPILQDISQLKSLYNQRWETFMGNSGIIQLFGNNDISTLDFISQRLGETSIIVQQKSQTIFEQKMKGGTGESYSTQVQKLLTTEEASRYFSRDDKQRRQLIIWAGRDPLILQRIKYYDKTLPEYKHFAGKYRDWS